MSTIPLIVGVKKTTFSVQWVDSTWSVSAWPPVAQDRIISVKPSNGYGHWLLWRFDTNGRISCLRLNTSSQSLVIQNSSETVDMDVYYI